MSDDKAKFLKEWVNDNEKAGEALEEAASACVSKHAKAATKTLLLSSALKRMTPRELSENTKQVFHQLTTVIEQLEGKDRQQAVKRLELSFERPVSHLQRKTKTQAEHISKRNKQVEEVEKHIKELRKLTEKSKKNPNKIQDQRNKLRDSKERLRLTEESLTKTLVDFESSKVAEMKRMLTQYAEIHMFMYAKGLERMTQFHQHVQELEPTVAYETMLKELERFGATRPPVSVSNPYNQRPSLQQQQSSLSSFNQQSSFNHQPSFSAASAISATQPPSRQQSMYGQQQQPQQQQQPSPRQLQPPPTYMNNSNNNNNNNMNNSTTNNMNNNMGNGSVHNSPRHDHSPRGSSMPIQSTFQQSPPPAVAPRTFQPGPTSSYTSNSSSAYGSSAIQRF